MDKKIDNLNIYIPEDYNKTDDYVLQVIVPQPAGRIGGSDTHVLQLSLQQKKEGILKPVVLFCRNPEYEQKLRNLNIAYISAVKETKILNMIKSLGKIPFIDKIKIIHSHQYNANYLTYAIKKKFKKLYGKIPTVMTCHGWIENNFKDKFFTMLDFATYSVANSLITVCDKDLNRLQKKKKYRKKKLYNIRNGVTASKNFSLEEIKFFKEKYNINNNNKTIAYVGRLAPEKRIDIFLQCCKHILETNDNINILIVGSGDEENNLRLLSKQLNIDKKVNFIGFISPIDIVYASIDMLLLTSDTEGTPRCVLEAMSYGVPVVSTNVGGLHEIINGKNGKLVDKGDYKAMSNIVVNLLKNNNELMSISQNAIKTINDKFTIQDMQQKINQVYKEIIN